MRDIFSHQITTRLFGLKIVVSENTTSAHVSKATNSHHLIDFLRFYHVIYLILPFLLYNSEDGVIVRSGTELSPTKVKVPGKLLIRFKLETKISSISTEE